MASLLGFSLQWVWHAVLDKLDSELGTVMYLNLGGILILLA